MRMHVENKYLHNYRVANSVTRRTPLFSNATHLKRRAITGSLARTLMAAQKIEASFNAKMKTKLKKRAGGKEVSKVPLNGFNWASGVVQQVDVLIGNPAQKLSLTADTASAMLWGRGECTDKSQQPCTPGRARLSPDGSRTLMISDSTWTTSYASGDTSGTIVKDVVKVGNILYEEQIFAVASNISEAINIVPTDGVLGLSFSTIAMYQTPTFFENIIKAQAIEQPIISFTLKNDAQHLLGELTIGGMDLRVIETPMVYNPVTLLAYWQIKSKGFGVNGKLVAGTAMECAVDTGSSMVYVPSATADAFFATIPDAAKTENLGWTIACDSQSTIKTIGISFSNTLYSVPLEALLIGTDPYNPSRCKLAISSGSNVDINGKPVAIIGTVFLQYVYTVLSYSQNGVPAVGFASFAGSKVVIESVVGGSQPSEAPAAAPSNPSAPSNTTTPVQKVEAAAQTNPPPESGRQISPTNVAIPPTNQPGGNSRATPGGKSDKTPTPDLDTNGATPVPTGHETSKPAGKKDDAAESSAGPNLAEPDAKPPKKSILNDPPAVAPTHKNGMKKVHHTGIENKPDPPTQKKGTEKGQQTTEHGPDALAPKPKASKEPEKTPNEEGSKEPGKTPNAKGPKDRENTPTVKGPKAPENMPTVKGPESPPAGSGMENQHNKSPANQSDLAPLTAPRVPTLTVDGNASNMGDSASSSSSTNDPQALGNGTMTLNMFRPASTVIGAASASVSKLLSTSAMLVLVSAWFLLLGV
ncbi:BQ2448_5421 [Microbotryum intermedium]|uniref:BQ2448_5421 protein n=1 Tax=Microbotryum intermedium TaxID=269621 RepID=A0A238F0X9_9BASI|nr:BQ2448_5421 [Microbotryum intermedium]